MKVIIFDNANYEEGLKVIVASGTVVWTEMAHVYYVPDKAVKILKNKSIPFGIVRRRYMKKGKLTRCNPVEWIGAKRN